MEWAERIAGLALGLAGIAGFWFWCTAVEQDDERTKEVLRCMRNAPAAALMRSEREVLDECYKAQTYGRTHAAGVQPFDPNAGD